MQEAGMGRREGGKEGRRRESARECVRAEISEKAVCVSAVRVSQHRVRDGKYRHLNSVHISSPRV